VAVIRDGKIAQVASPEELYARPVDEDLARFVGAANLVEGVQDGNIVHSQLGEAISVDAPTMSGPHAVTVLVRPEQLEIVAGDGMLARVVVTSYHGHDCLLQVLPATERGGPILVRTLGDPHLATGSPVTLRIRDAVLTWPAANGAGASSGLASAARQSD